MKRHVLLVCRWPVTLTFGGLVSVDRQQGWILRGGHPVCVGWQSETPTFGVYPAITDCRAASRVRSSRAWVCAVAPMMASGNLTFRCLRNLIA